MINYAHRGASEYSPENTLSSFYLGLIQGANGIETDIRKTKDGHLVLFHDDTLDRVTDSTGRVSDYTLEELKYIKVYGNSTTRFYDRILTYRDFLKTFSHYDIHFAIELKGASVEEETLSLSEEFNIMSKATFTSFNLDCLKEVKRINPNARIGWLVKNADESVILKLLQIGGEEIAPKAENISQELVHKLKRRGLGVRAWGVGNTSLMKEMCRLKVDGMTVNFPDRLFNYLNSAKV